MRAGIRWYVAFLAVFLACGVAGEILGTVSPLPAWFTTLMLALNIAVGGTIVFTLLALFAKQRQDALTALQIAQDQAENLLLNVLPRPIAERLKAEPQTIADQFTSASILFADVVDFTQRSEQLSPAEVVGILDHLFSHFDMLAERYAVEKIKTIGDAYMVAAGVPSPRPDHARALALMALDMVDAMRSQDGVAHLGLELRVGINSGPVVAGVIGRKRFLYDLWGDAVNIASRMESQGTPGRIQITRATRDLIEDEFVCEPRGTISVKGKGEMETWYLLERRTTAPPDGVAARWLRELDDLDEVAAGVVEDRRGDAAHLGRLLGESHALRPEPIELLLDVVDGEGGRRDPVLDQGLLVRLDGRVPGGFEQELGSVRLFRRHDGQPRGTAEGDVRLLLEAEDVGVEVEGLRLVVDEDARDIDPHSNTPFSLGWASAL